MLSPDLIRSIFARGPSRMHPENPYHSRYNSLPCTAFSVLNTFFLPYNLDTMTVFFPTIGTTRKPVKFVFLIAPDNAPATWM